MTLSRILVFSFLVALFYSVPAQNENDKWYFGNNAGLDFSTTPPTVLTNGAMSTLEGCASISDASGNLLFYTDGISVWNNLHQLMPNGTGLMGNSSTTQSGIIVKQPGSSNIYYVFTQEATAGTNGFRYSIVDMSQAGGLGDVTTKNTLLHTPSCEKITAARHCNGVDVWVISHDYGSNEFRTFLVTASGVSSTPVISSVGSVVSNVSNVTTLGQMKIAQNGVKLGMVIFEYTTAQSVEVFDFDPFTGAVSNPLILGTFTNLYGCEFSPNSQMFYASVYSPGAIYQWNLCAGTSTAIVASMYNLNAMAGTYGALQVAKDGKIYIAKQGDSILPIINTPDVPGIGCNFVQNGISLHPRTSNYGLPNFVNNFPKPASAPFTYSADCSSSTFWLPGTQTVISGCSTAGNNIISQLWNFGDPGSAGSNTSTLANPSHKYAAQGNYTVQLIVNFKCTSDTLVQTITVQGTGPEISVTGPTTMCQNDKRKITASGAHYYHWSTGEGTAGIFVSPAVSSTYAVKGSNTVTGCEATKVITLTVLPCTGVETIPLEEAKVNIFPNPTQGLLKFDAEEPLKIEIFDPLGTLIYIREIPAGNFTADLSMQNPGIYMVRFTGEHSIKVVRLQKVE